jgi:hypothetical protein
VGALLALARRRCSDDKAGVRRAAVQLLEALMLLRASGAGGAEFASPSEADLESVQHAAADPMVRHTVPSLHPHAAFCSEEDSRNKEGTCAFCMRSRLCCESDISPLEP